MINFLKQKIKNITLLFLEISYKIGKSIWQFFGLKDNEAPSNEQLRSQLEVTEQNFHSACKHAENIQAQLSDEKEKHEESIYLIEQKNHLIEQYQFQYEDQLSNLLNFKLACEKVNLEKDRIITMLSSEKDEKNAQIFDLEVEKQKNSQDYEQLIKFLTNENNELKDRNAQQERALEALRAKQQLESSAVATKKIEEPRTVASFSERKNTTRKNKQLSESVADKMIVATAPLCLFSLGFVSQHYAQYMPSMINYIAKSALSWRFERLNTYNSFRWTWDLFK